MSGVLEVDGLSAGYFGQRVIHEVDLAVQAGEVVCLLGSNGVGKTTTLLALSGELKPMSGTVSFAGLGPRSPLHRRARRGLSYVTEERSVFKAMTARENLRCAGVSVDEVTALFPELEKCIDTKGGLLSGGEQQMLTLGRALARRPKLLLADELSLGLAPLVVDRLLTAVRTAAKESGTGALIVEQHVRKALKHADRVYLMRRGRIELALTAAEARSRIDEIERSYLSSAVLAEDRAPE
ncbi:ABC transporter ATP-binding protein [Aeromicrobium wangtongii]|uniref:ABC transporter ATP-binding protein n=1 Tax=Aeromicrobium wangtongii TaxID=2969247 RepID=UPI00201748B3|nr:ABC transporter ATP-binding protein [Aeromicrobium wangtongii]MCL3818610.1 ABC transporter ATP-binding protein [Aeromicrobium wangtongii]